MLASIVAILAAGCVLITDEELAARQDFDGDGAVAVQFGGDDCADDDDAVGPAAVELCDGVDNDCDGSKDEDAADAQTWYADPDGDGFGGAEKSACSEPDGYISVSGDCDNGNASINPDAIEVWYDGVDQDCRGDDDFDQDADGFRQVDDCDDENEDINPEIVEVYYDTVDANCDGLSDFDADQDGFDIGDDCDDTQSAIYPGAEDTWYDGLDANCDESSDFDADGDGFDAVEWGGADCDDSAAGVNPGVVEIWYSGIDENCDGLPDYDQDGDGFDLGDDCDDVDSAVNPGATDVWYDGTDTNCDTASDYDQDADGFDVVAFGGADCDDLTGVVYPGAADDWYDGVDANCDGASDFDADADGQDVDSAGGSDCDDGDVAVYLGAAELCDAVDSDCDGDVAEDDSLDALVWYADFDGDGFGDVEAGYIACAVPVGFVADATDCDDADVGAFPGALESCDTTDSDCDGDINDPDAIDAIAWFADGDGDGFGVAESTTTACTAPAGYSAEIGDCDETRASVNPGEVEVCDAYNLDEDCSGAADDDDAGVTGLNVYYADVDGDRYGDLGSTISMCERPSTHVTNKTDCDDLDEDANPGEDEVCDALDVDEDCDGVVDDDDASVSGQTTYWVDADGDGFGSGSAAGIESCEIPAGYRTNELDCDDSDASVSPSLGNCDLSSSRTRWSAYGQTRQFGISLCVLDDYDGDGATDFAVGSDYLNNAGQSNGGVSVLALDATGEVSPTTATLTIVGHDVEAAYRLPPAGADLDGDGFSDILVGAPLADNGGSNAGAVYIFLAGRSGVLSTSGADAEIVGAVDDDFVGSALAWLGDVDGNGVPEALIGAPYVDAAGADAGSAYVLEPPSSGAATSSSAKVTLVGEGAGDMAGYSVAAVDFDGDGVQDPVVGTPVALNDAAIVAGAVYVVSGALSGTISLSAATTTIRGEALWDLLGRALASIGDIDGDGLDDLLVGAPGDDAGGTDAGGGFVFLGGSTGSLDASDANASVLGASTNGRAGDCVSPLGDVNDDGVPDIGIGAPYTTGVSSQEGRAYVIFGPPSGTMSLADADGTVFGESSGSQAGWSLAGVGDVDGDAWGDVLVGAVGNIPSYPGYASGAVYLVSGGAL